MVKISLVLSGLLAAAFALPSHDIVPHKIVGGEDAAQGELPYQISLRVNILGRGIHICGGSLVVVKGIQLIVTAAVCVDGLPPDILTIVAGDVDSSDTTGIEQTRNVTHAIIHEGYTGLIGEPILVLNDIALLTIDRPLELNANVAPIALPQQGQDTQGDVLVSGWGTLDSESWGDFPDILQKVTIPVVSDAACEQAYEMPIAASMLCAGLLGEGGKDSCQGDQGGPLVSVSGGYLAGIVSWGNLCADPYVPRISTKVAYFVDWINSKVLQLKAGQF